MRAVWPSVYAFVCESRTSSYTATAFLLKKQIHGQRADYYFMTAGHAIDDCKQPRRYLTENIDQRPFESDGITLAMPLPRLEPVERVYLDDAYNVAVVKVEAAASLRIGEPLAVDDKCDRALHREIYAVGFPGVAKRRSLGLKREEKRWSKGDYVGLGRAEFRDLDLHRLDRQFASGGAWADRWSTGRERWWASSCKASQARRTASATMSIPKSSTIGSRSWCHARPCCGSWTAAG